MVKTLSSTNASSAVTMLCISAGAKLDSAKHVIKSHWIACHNSARVWMAAHLMENTQIMVLNILLVADCVEKSQIILFN